MKSIVRFSYIMMLGFVTSCGVMPQLLQEAEHIIDDSAITQKISQEALQKGTNVRATIEVCNSKDDFPK